MKLGTGRVHRHVKAKHAVHVWKGLKFKPEYPVPKRRKASQQRALNRKFHFLKHVAFTT